MMHDVHTALTSPAGLAGDMHDGYAPADGDDDRPGTVWWTVMDFIRAAVEAKANFAGAAVRFKPPIQ